MTDFTATIKALDAQSTRLNASSKLIQDGAEFIPDLTNAPATAGAIVQTTQPAKIGKDWDEMSRAEQLYNSTAGGFHGLKKSWVARDAERQAVFAEQGLRAAYDVEESLDPEADAAVQALLTGNNKANRDFKEDAQVQLGKEVQRYRELQAQDVLYKQPEAMERMSKAAEGKGFWSGLGAAAGEFFSGDVVGNAIYLAGSSTGAMFPYIAAAAFTGGVAGLSGVGALTNVARGLTMAYGSYQNEFGQFTLDELERRGVKPGQITAQSFIDLVSDPNYDQFASNRANRASFVSAFDFVSGYATGLRLNPSVAYRTLRTGLNGVMAHGAEGAGRAARMTPERSFMTSRGFVVPKAATEVAETAGDAARATEKAVADVAADGVAKTAGKAFASDLENMASQATVQGFLGGAGEYLGSKAAGLDPNMADVLMEAIGEFTSAPVEVATSAVSSVTDARRQVLHAQVAKTFQEAMAKANQAAETVGLKIADQETVDQWAKRVGEGKSFSAFAQDLVENKQVEEIRKNNPELADQIEQAAAEGKSVDIPVSTIVSIATKDRKAADNIIMDCRPTVDGLSVRQAEDFAKNGRKKAEKQFDRTLKRFRVPENITKEANEIGSWIQTRLVEAKFSDDYAASCSAIWKSYLVQRAKLLGVSPKEVARMMNWSLDLGGRETTGKTGPMMPMAAEKRVEPTAQTEGALVNTEPNKVGATPEEQAPSEEDIAAGGIPLEGALENASAQSPQSTNDVVDEAVLQDELDSIKDGASTLMMFGETPVEEGDSSLHQDLTTAIPSDSAVREGEYDDPRYVRQWADFRVAMRNASFAQKVADSFRAIPGLRGAMKNATNLTDAIEAAIDQMADNLVWLYNQIPENIRARSKLWYDGAEKASKVWSKRYGLRSRQTAAVIAIFSPQTDWYLNMSMAERLLDIYFSARRSAPTTEHEEALKARCETDKVSYDDVKGKTLDELMKEKKFREAGAWVRAYDAVHNPKEYNVETPEGGVGGVAKTASGRANATFHYMTTGTISKALQVIIDDDPNKIYDLIGSQFKVRDFYNNIYRPSNPKAATIDTHAVGADTMSVVGPKSVSVNENFGSIRNSVSGQTGTFPFHFEAYRRAAERVGLLPREMQSITWEAIRALFPEELKAGLRGKVEAIWTRFDNGEINADQAREEIVKAAGGFRPTAWENVPFNDEITQTYDRSHIKLYDDITQPLPEPSLSLEAAPDPHDTALVEKWNQLSDTDKLAVTEEIVPWVIERVSLTTKTLISEATLQRGGYLGTPNYSMTCRITDHGDYVRVGRLLASYLRQDSVMAVSQATGEGMFPSKMVRIELPEGFTVEQIDALYAKLDMIRAEDGRQLLPGHSAVDGVMNIAVDAKDVDAIEVALQESLGDIKWDIDDAYVGFLEAYSEEEKANAKNDTGRSSTVQEEASSGYDADLQAETDKRLAEAVDRRLSAREAGVRGRSASTARSEREVPPRVGAQGSSSVPGRTSQEGQRNFEGVVRAEDIHTTKEYGEPGRPGAVRLLCIHFSKAPRPVLDGSFYGTGMRGAEARRVEGDSVLSKRIYFYNDIGNGIIPEDNVGNVVHAVLLNNIYDISEDPLGIRKEVSRTVTSESRYGNELERRIRDAGFDGYVGASSGKWSRSVVLIGDHKVPVDVVGTFTTAPSQNASTSSLATSQREKPAPATAPQHAVKKFDAPKELRDLAKVPGSGVTEDSSHLFFDDEGLKKARAMWPEFERWHQVRLPDRRFIDSRSFDNGLYQDEIIEDEELAARDEEYLSAVQSGDMDKARDMVETRAKEKGYGNAIPEQAGGWKVRTKPAPKKHIKAYKVFFVDRNGLPSTLFVGDPQALPMGVWLDAKEAFYIVDARNGKKYVPTFSNPNRVDAKGKKKTQKTGITIPIPDEATKRELVRRGYVTEKATTVTCVAYRPGWHAATLPYFPQGGQKVAGSNYGNVHEARQVVYEILISADKDYTDIARSQEKARTKSGGVNARMADLDYLPKDGMYYYTTNPMLNPSEDGWVIADSIKVVRALTQEECDSMLADAGKLPQEWAQGKLVLEDLGITDPTRDDSARKTLAPVTYDESGNVIPLSKRFDPNNDSVLYQNEDNRPRVRGAYNPVNVFNPTQGLAGVIRLAETADRSTFMHESAHAWLDADTMLGLKLAQKVRDGEKLTVGETAFLKNLGGFFEWGQREKVLDLGVVADDPLSVAYALEQWVHMPVADQRGMHELFARGFESYLLNGESPSPEMTSLFQRFRSWLKDIYARAKNALKPISPEVKKLYDLMFVSEQEAADAESRAGLQAMFDEADRKKFMTDEESAQYEMLEEEANAETQSLISRAVSGPMGTFTRFSDKVRRQIMRQYKARVDEQEKILMQQPRYKAWHILRRGWQAEDGTVWRFKLSGEALKRGGYDKKTIKLLRHKRFVTDSRPGISLSKLAQIVGAKSATELLGELLEVTSAKEEAADIIASQTQEETGHDIETYSRLKADLAAHNKVRSRLLNAEYNVLARLMGRKQLLVGAAREYAQKRLSTVKVSELKPYSYELDERRCANEAEEAWRKGDYQRCLEMKRAQIVNHELARVALEIKDEQTKAIRRLKRGLKSEAVHPANRQILAYVAYLHDLAPIPKQYKALVKSGELKHRALSAASGLLAEGTPVDGLSPDPETGFAQSPLLENNLRVKDMTVDMARDLFSMLQQVEKLGRDRLTIEKNGIKEDARQEIAEGSQALAVAAENQHRVRQLRERTPTSSRAVLIDRLKQFFYAHIKIATWCRIFDRNKDGGFFWNHFIRSANERANWEESKRAEVAQRLQEILAVVADDKTGIWDRDFVKIGGMMLSKGERIAAALNMGNESNLQRLRDGDPTQWTGSAIQELKESLSSAEWIMVQNIWDLFESLRPLIAEKQKRVYGVEPIWIDPKPFEVVPTDGAPTTVRGGYYPVVYDPRGSKRAEQLSAAAAAEQLMKGAFQSSTTNRSFTKQRSEQVLDRPLRLDLSALYSGLDDIIHDLAWHEWLINTQRLLNGVDGNGSGLSEQIKQLYGSHVAKAFDEWTQAIAQGDRSNVESFARDAMKWLAGNIGLTAMGFSVSSAVSQITGIGYIVPRAGVQATLGAIRDAMSGRMALRAAINERSELMRTRFISANRQVSEVRNRLEKGKEGFIKKYAYVMMMGVQHAVDTICWQAQYRRCLSDGVPEEEAIARADQAVIDTQSSGRIVDESAVERSDLLGPFTVFYSWANAALNMEYAVLKGEENKAKRFAAIMFYALLMPQIDALLRDCLKAQGDNDDDDDDDAWWLSALIRKPFANAAELHFGMFVGFREVSSTVKGVIAGEKVFDYAGPGGTRGVTVGGKGLQAIAEIGDSLWNDDKDFSWKSFNALIDVAGFAGAPTAQIKRTIKGVRAIESGQAEGFDALKAPVFGFEGPIEK